MNSFYIQQEIEKKKMMKPYCPINNIVYQIQTDMNVFPYTRYFRGRQDSDSPFFFEREAGYSPICNSISYQDKTNQNLLLANTCFQMPCSTILPCRSNSFQPNLNFCVYTSP